MSGRLGVSFLDIDQRAVPVTATSERLGLSVTDGDIVFSSPEDLGMGLRAAASLGLQLRGRDAGVMARDASVALSGAFGSLTLGAVEAPNGVMRLAGAGAPVIGQDSDLIGAVTISRATNVDFIQYTSPELVPGLRARLMLLDSIGPAHPPGRAAVVGGMGSNEPVQDATLVGLAYSAGPIAVDADFTQFGRNALAGTVLDDRIRVSGSYDFGVLRIGAGWERLTNTGLEHQSDAYYMFGISAPVGPRLVLGATYSERNPGAQAFDTTGYEVGAQYNFSRRTSLQIAFLGRFFKDSIASAPVTLHDETRTQLDTRHQTVLRLRLMHTF